MPSRPALRLVLVLPLLVAALLSSCSGDDPDPPPPDPITTAPRTTHSQAATDEAALRQLAEDWYAQNRLLYRSQEDPRTAAQYLSDPYLSDFVDRLLAFRKTGNRGRLDARSSHLVLNISVAGKSAVVTECVIDADVLLSADGAVLNDAVVRKTYRTTAERSAEGWRFTHRLTELEEEGVDECDPA